MVFLDQHAHAAGEVARSVGKQLHFFQAQGFAPLVHDKRIIDRDAIDLVDAACLELVIEAFISRALLVRTGRGECARQGEYGDSFACEQVLGIHVLPAERVFAVDRFVANAGFQGNLGDISTDHIWLHVVRYWFH